MLRANQTLFVLTDDFQHGPSSSKGFHKTCYIIHRIHLVLWIALSALKTTGTCCPAFLFPLYFKVAFWEKKITSNKSSPGNEIEGNRLKDNLMVRSTETWQGCGREEVRCQFFQIQNGWSKLNKCNRSLFVFTWTVNIWKLCYLQFLKATTHFGLLSATSYHRKGKRCLETSQEVCTPSVYKPFQRNLVMHISTYSNRLTSPICLSN